MNLRRIYTHLLILASIVISGCATIYTPPPPQPTAKLPGIYHEVKTGETLWRIAKAYNMPVEKITKANRIAKAAQISAGQMLFIPGAARIQNVSPNYSGLSPSDFIWPVKGKIISFFGTMNGGMVNKGIDIKTIEGEDILASRTGRVIFADEKLKGFGKTLIIDHGDNYSSVYAHNSKILVKAGDEVKKWQVIAKAGSTGRASEPFLHYEIRKGHEPQNPFYYLP